LHAQQHVAATRVSRIRSLARLEDACQAPLIAGYHVLPEQNRDEARM
jgi:hypothetical protein